MGCPPPKLHPGSCWWRLVVMEELVGELGGVWGLGRGWSHCDGPLVLRIQVNDLIVEVDGTSLVGVTQSFAASVLRNTKGRVR